MKFNIKTHIYIMIFLLILTGCTNDSSQNENVKSDNGILLESINDYELEIDELEDLVDEYEIRIESIEEELTGYKNFNKKTIAYLNEEELLDLANDIWNYKIEIDGMSIPPNGEIQISKNNFEVVCSEEIAPYQILPSEIINQGKISGEYFDHLVIHGYQPSEISRTDGIVITAFVYKFEDIPSNTSINFELSDELKKRVGINTNTINITIK